MRVRWDWPGIGAARDGLVLVLALLLVACDKQPAVQTAAPAAPAPVVTKKVGQPESTDADKSPDSMRKAANAALAAKVKAALASEPKLKGTGIDVVTEDGRASLFGTVASARLASLAAKVASQVAGVTSVTNKLVVVAGS